MMGYVGDTAFSPGQKKKKKKTKKKKKKTITRSRWRYGFFARAKKKTKHITTFGALGGLAFDSAFDIKQANLSERKMYYK